MEPPAPAEEEPNHTSPTRQRGISEIPKMSARIVSQALCEEITCAEPPKKCIEPRPTPALPPSEPPQAPVVAGTVPVPSSIPAPSAPRRTNDQGPLTEDEPTTDQGPLTKDETQRKRFDALPQRIQREIIDIRSRLWHHNGRPHLSKEQVSEFVAFLDKHLGKDSIGPESCLRERQQNRL